MTNFGLGSLNVHRADCRRTEHPVCGPWSTRAPQLINALSASYRASVYSFQECTWDQAVDITKGLGWGNDRNPAFAWDENQNVVAWDRSKWRDIEVRAVSLSTHAGDTGDTNRRSICWVLLEHLASHKRVWVGASHLETGNPDARAAQARVLTAHLPDGPLVFGIDRNSYTLSAGAPRATFAAAGLTEAGPIENPHSYRSFAGFEKPVTDGKSIDGVHYRGLTFRNGRMVYSWPVNFTDHNGLTVGLAI